MRWEDERYVRLYTRDTIDWHFLSFEAQGLMCLLLRKVDRAGIIDLGRHGPRGVAAAVGHPGRADVIAKALDELVADGCVQISEGRLVIPNFIEAQEAKTSDAQRKRDQRERDRDQAIADGFHGSTTGAYLSAKQSRAVTPDVTSGHTASQAVTPNLTSLTSLTEPTKDLSLALEIQETTSDPVVEVFEAYREALGKNSNTVLDEKRRKLIRERLKHYSPDQLKRAAQGFARSDWHMGRDQKTGGKRYDAPKYLFGDNDRVEKFLAMADGPGLAQERRSPCGWPGCARESNSVVWGLPVCFGHVEAAQDQHDNQRQEAVG